MRMYTINLLVKDGPYSDGTFTLQQAEVGGAVVFVTLLRFLLLSALLFSWMSRTDPSSGLGGPRGSDSRRAA